MGEAKLSTGTQYFATIVIDMRHGESLDSERINLLLILFV